MNFFLNPSTINDSQQLERLDNGSIFQFDDNLTFDFHVDLPDLYEIFEENLSSSLRKTSNCLCYFCSKLFISEYGLNYHTNMYHPTQSLICSDCQITFRSHRALKTHQQRSHSSVNLTSVNYNKMSSYLVVAFSSELFPVICANACLEKSLPLGELSSKYFRCSNCHLSFPCSRTLNYHQLNQHTISEKQITDEIEQTTNEDLDEFQSMQNNLSRKAQHLGLILKSKALKKHHQTESFNAQIYPKCSHPSRTCANLCLKFLPSYDTHIRNYKFKITLVPKGSPFSQGSIISKVPVRSLTNEAANVASPKRKTIKRISSSVSDISTSTSIKKKSIEPNNKINDISSKSISVTTKKGQTKTAQLYTRSFSTNSLSSKRSRSPVIGLAVERSAQKRKRQREQRKTVRETSPVSVELDYHDNDDDVEQENGDNETNVDRSQRSKERQASTGSIEYIQILSNDSQSTSSLNNIENLKNESPPSPKKMKASTTTQPIQTIDDEHILVRCKVCGDILEGRSRFSKHVLTMHSHLVNKTINNRQQQTTVVR